MKPTYLCPKCRAVLNIAGNVILSVKNEKGEYGLILLHPSLGNYEVIHHHDFKIREGKKSHFHCPACYASLEYGKEYALANVIMYDENKNEFKIVFSRKKGEESTYKIQGENVELYGGDSHKYLDFINLCKFD